MKILAGLLSFLFLMQATASAAEFAAQNRIRVG
jgi:hypothetical protein